MAVAPSPLAAGAVGTAAGALRDAIVAAQDVPLAPKVGSTYLSVMRIIARRTLREGWKEHADAEQPLKA